MKRRLQNITNKIPAVISLCGIVFLWYCLCAFEIVPAYMLPSPWDVICAFIEDFNLIMQHTKVTLLEAMYGLLLGIVLAFLIATIMDRFHILYQAGYPIMIITQTIPTIAIAPLLVLWMGFGMAPKIALVALTTFFPIAIGLLEGYCSVDEDYIQLMLSMGANKRQIFTMVKIPAALSHFFSGLKISVSYAVVGAVISEWLGGFEGLGVYMTRVKKAYAFDRMFAVILLIVAISLLLMGFVNVLRNVSMPWICKGETEYEDKKNRNCSM